MIQFSHVFKRYPGGFDALKDVSFELAQGEMAFITGHSGAGKSTLLKLITHIEVPTRGSLLVNHKNVARLARRQLPYFRRSVGVVFQDYRLLVPARETGRRVRAALEKVGLLQKERIFPLQLSGGEQQRVGIARAVVNRPPLLLADEPTGNLDAALSDEIMELFLDFHRHGTTVLIASHDQRLIASSGKRVLELRLGEVVADHGGGA